LISCETRVECSDWSAVL